LRAQSHLVTDRAVSQARRFSNYCHLTSVARRGLIVTAVASLLDHRFSRQPRHVLAASFPSLQASADALNEPFAMHQLTSGFFRYQSEATEFSHSILSPPLTRKADVPLC
jgi:hypothetical protein